MVCLPLALPLISPGVGGVDGDGDIMRSENITAFQEFVIRSTNNEGVHFVMGDGVSTMQYSCFDTSVLYVCLKLNESSTALTCGELS